MTKTNAAALAQRTANQTGHITLIVNLNPFGSLWVVREWNERLVKELPTSQVFCPHA